MWLIGMAFAPKQTLGNINIFNINTSSYILTHYVCPHVNKVTARNPTLRIKQINFVYKNYLRLLKRDGIDGEPIIYEDFTWYIFVQLTNSKQILENVTRFYFTTTWTSITTKLQLAFLTELKDCYHCNNHQPIDQVSNTLQDIRVNLQSIDIYDFSTFHEPTICFFYTLNKKYLLEYRLY